MARLTHTTELVVSTCWCGIPHAVPEELHDKQARDHRDGRTQMGIYCPLGHTYILSGEGEAEKLRKQLAEEKLRRQAEKDLREDTERRLIAQQGQTTKARKRAAARGGCRVPVLQPLVRSASAAHGDEAPGLRSRCYVKPGAGPKRDPEKTRAWVEKHRNPLRSAGPLDGVPVQRAKRRRKPAITVPPETRAAARARSGGKCIVCLFDGRGDRRNGKAKADHLHHVFPRSKWPTLIPVEDNLAGMCVECHAAHEGASRRIPLLALPECVFRLAADVGPAAVDYLLKTYPETEG